MYPVVSLDFESSDYKADSACALGMARVDENGVTATWYHCIRPPRSRVYFTEIHGLTWPMLKDQPSFEDLWPDIQAFLDGARWLVAHNASFDRRMLHGCCAAFGLAAPEIPFLCTLKGARRALPLPSRSLDAVCSHLNIELNHHHAGSDALAAARIFIHLSAVGVTTSDMRLGSGRK